MLEKKYIKSRKIYKVTFTIPDVELPDNLQVESLSVAGDFNDWNPETTPMKRNKQGANWAEIELNPGQGCEFRYVANGEYWFNAWEADTYVPNSMGTENCVVTAPQENQ